MTFVDTPEELDSPLAADPESLAAHLAAEKAHAAVRAGRGEGAATVIVAFDTIVLLDGRILGKPRDVDDAWRMLRDLSGRTHEVVTGVAVLSEAMADPATLAVSTNVRMKPLTDLEISAWMAHGEFMGCAGAYNIEGQVAEVDVTECFQNVAGLPLCHLWRLLASLDLRCELGRLSSPIPACDEALDRRCALGPTVLRTEGAS